MLRTCFRNLRTFETALLLLCLFFVGCGILIGNPEDEIAASGISGEGDFSPLADGPPVDFSSVLEAYLSSTSEDGEDCGLFDIDSTEIELNEGRDCLRVALEDCHPAILYIRQVTNKADDQYASFVRVKKSTDGTCSIKVRTVSSDADLFFGDVTRSCDTLDIDEIPEFACGIAFSDI